MVRPVADRPSRECATSRRSPNVRAALLLATVALWFALGAGVQSVYAQAAQPSPAALPAGTGSLSEGLTRMTLEATRILPYLIYEVESPLMGWFIKLAQMLTIALMMTAFLKLFRQHQGGALDTFWWFGRVAVCFAIVTMTTLIIDFGSGIGTAIASGSDTNDAWLNTVRRGAQESFNESYAKFQAGTFTVRVRGEDLPVNPNPSQQDPAFGIMGVLYNRESKIDDVTTELKNLWSMPTLFSALSLCRGVLELSDLWLLLSRSFLLIFMRLLAPFMVAIAVDRQFANQSSYKFAWGVAVLTLVFPAVVQGLRILAYTAGNMALMLGDDEPLYIWDRATMTAVTSPLSQPVFVIAVLGIVMFVAGVMMILAPFLSYWIVMGKVYEGVAQITNGVMSGMASTGVGTVSAATAAAINRQAEQMQVHGAADAEGARVEGRKTSADLSAKGNETVGVASARGSQVAQLASIEGNRRAGVIQAAATGQLGRDTAAASVREQSRQINISHTQSNQMTVATNRREQQQIAGEASAQKMEGWSRGAGQAVPVLGGWSGGVAESATGATGNHPISIRNRTNRGAANVFADEAQNQQNVASETGIKSQQQYGSDVSAAYTRQEGANTGAANVAAGVGSGGVNRGTAITIGGISAKYSHDLKANQTDFAAGMKAAEISRAAGLEAARLKERAAVIAAFGSIASHQISGMSHQLRF